MSEYDYGDGGLPSANPNFHAASAEPYQQVFDRFQPGGAPAADMRTPIQQALADQGRQAPAPPAGAPPPPPGQGQLPPNLVNPYEPPAQPEQGYGGQEGAEPDVASLYQRMQEQQEQLEEMGQFQQMLLQAAQQEPQPEQGYEQPYPPVGYPVSLPEDPYDPEQMQSWYAQTSESIRSELEQTMGQQVQQLWQEQFAPFAPILGQIAQREAEQAAGEVFEGLQEQIGKFDSDKAYVYAIAYSQQGYEPEQALELGARARHEDEKAMFNQIMQAQQQTLDNVSAAPTEMGAPPMAASQIEPVPTGPGRYEEAKNRYFSRRGGSPIPTA